MSAWLDTIIRHAIEDGGREIGRHAAEELASLRTDNEKLRAKLAAADKLKAENPRAFKLMERGRFFVVVADDETYFSWVYSIIRAHEKADGCWTADDETTYQVAIAEYQKAGGN